MDESEGKGLLSILLAGFDSSVTDTEHREGRAQYTPKFTKAHIVPPENNL